jgi:hypothetical protein
MTMMVTLVPILEGGEEMLWRTKGPFIKPSLISLQHHNPDPT